MTTFAEILNAAMNLPPHQRGELATVLQESVAEERPTTAPLRLSDAWQRELARREAEVDAGTASYVTYEQMRERARNR